LLIIAELGFWCCEGLFCFVVWAWAVSVLLEALLNPRHHQATKWAMLELLPWQLRWRRTAACRRWILAVSGLILIFV
jgi:hypothetical protein